MSAEARAEFEAVAEGCLVEAVLAGAGKAFSSYFTDFDGILRNPVVQTVLNETGQMGQTGVPAMPMYIYKPIGDEISPVADTDLVYSALCEKGAQIEYRRNLVGEHNTEAILGSGAAMEWIGDRLDGKPVAAGCEVKDVLVTVLDAGVLESFGLELIAILENVLGGDVGPSFVGWRATN